MKYLSIIFILFFFVNCGNQQEKELTEISQKIQEAFENKDYKYINSLLYVERLMEKGFIRLKVPYKLMKQQVKILKKEQTLMKLLGYYGSDDKTYTVISNDAKKITVSILQEDKFINYVDFIFKEIKDELKIIDLYYHQQGYNFSDEIQSMATILKESDYDTYRYEAYIRSVRGIRSAIEIYDIESAKSNYELIDKSYRNLKVSQALHITIASYDAESNFEAIVDSYIKKYPEAHRHIDFLNLMKSVYDQNCSGIKHHSQEVWKATGVDSFLLKDYYTVCLDDSELITN